jgi:hypothetical protein
LRTAPARSTEQLRADPAGAKEAVSMPEESFDRDELNKVNLEQIDKLHPGAFYMVKSLLWECQRKERDTFLKLHDAEPDGHVVHYEVVRGDPQLVVRLAKALGFKNVTESVLEVRSV